MQKTILHDPIFLQRPSRSATKDDLAIARDLADTLSAHADHCVGLAANMIGESVRILAVLDGSHVRVLVNPEIIKHSARRYKTEEGCLSLEGVRPTERYESIEVRYRDEAFRKQRGRFSGLVAEAIQHEMDHFAGCLI
ncbi:peptide deformylase [uncultured Selenomonas sp.]|uniref:peptide deformylase n=1 Tax=uncultured Selenomonas sp. TaxID=159275 RepID=UPI0025F24CC4|nr:peptide deformylase [uncultured Selenomonas sp.]